MLQTLMQQDVASSEFSCTMDFVTKKRASQGVSVAIEPAVSAALSTWAELKMHDKKAAVTRLISWFLERPDTLQDAVIGRATGDMAPLYAAELRRLADEIEAQPTLPTNRITGKLCGVGRSATRTKDGVTFTPASKAK